jgi:hypothetical protein
MRLRGLILHFPEERPYAGFLGRLAYHSMDNILRSGWTAEKAAHLYGGMSEAVMRRAVAYACRNGFLS